MRNTHVTSQPRLRSSDTLYRPDFMLKPQNPSRLPTPAQLAQRKALNTAPREEKNELVEIDWWQDR